MLLILAGLFAGLCCFTFWLRTGVYRPWESEHYADVLMRSFRPSGAEQITLSDFLTSPISVKDVEVYGIIMGLLLASLSSIPLLVAILYRFPFSIPFAIMVMFLAAMPWLGFTVLGGCVLASLRPLRFSFRFASALIGLIPIAIYFVSASLEPAASNLKLTQHQALLYAPWVLAVLGSCIICALALAIARLIDYRPGGIPPVLAVLFAIPVFLFHSHVGRDELEYRLLAREVGPGSRAMFRMVDIGEAADRAATRRWSRSRSESYDRIHRSELKRAAAKVLVQCEVDRAHAVDLCDAFILHFPKSRHVPNVLFLKGRVQNQRIQRRRLEQDHRAEFRWDVPSPASRRTNETLLEQFPESDPGAVAMYQLAILEARCGGEGMDRAIALLGTLTRRFDAALAAGLPQGPSDRERTPVFRKAPPSMGLGIDMRVLVRRARRLQEMLTSCRADASKPYAELFGALPGAPGEQVHPMQLLLWLDDADPHYKVNMEGISRHFGDSRTRGYVEIRLALLEPAISRRIQRFRSAAASLRGQPAGAEALLHLGDALQDDSILDEAKEAYDELAKQYPESCRAEEALERLSSLSLLETIRE
jgi:outer membrane protein assembly factor BamD (BamD/ComL family)